MSNLVSAAFLAAQSVIVGLIGTGIVGAGLYGVFRGGKLILTLEPQPIIAGFILACLSGIAAFYLGLLAFLGCVWLMGTAQAELGTAQAEIKKIACLSKMDGDARETVSLVFWAVVLTTIFLTIAIYGGRKF